MTRQDRNDRDALLALGDVMKPHPVANATRYLVQQITTGVFLVTVFGILYWLYKMLGLFSWTCTP